MSRVERNSKSTLTLVLFVFSILIVGCQCQSCLQFTLPCIPRNPQVRAPGPGQYGIHSTRIRTDEDCPTAAACCVMLSKNQDPDRTIDTMGDDPRLSLIFSPGFELEPPVPYGREIFVRYEIVCPDNNMIQYSVSIIDMEGPTCFGQCVDYVRFLGNTQGSGNIGDVEFCGNTPSDNFLHPTNTLTVVFRTDRDGEFPGFKGQTLCLQTEGVFVGGRKKRETFVRSDFEAFNNLWRRRLSHYIHTKRENFSGRFKRFSFRFEDLIVRYGFSFSYTNQQLVIREDRTSMEDRKISGVRWLHTFDDKSVVSHFRGSADSLSFRGAGPLTVLGDHVYFVHFLVDPRGILPETEEEKRVFRLLAYAHFDRVLEYPDEELCDALLNPTVEEPPDTDPDCPLPRTTAPLTCDVTDEILGLAIQSLNSHILAIRTVADVIVDCTNLGSTIDTTVHTCSRNQPGRVPNVPSPPAPLTAQCNITSGTFFVSCHSNRQRGVRISECSIDRNISILSDCTFPAFTFSGRALTAGVHSLSLTFIDSIESEDTDLIFFFVTAMAPILDINCMILTEDQTGVIPIVVRTATVVCMSDYDDSLISTQSCIIDQIYNIPCTFPMFEFMLPRGIIARNEPNSLIISVTDDQQRTAEDVVQFRIPFET